MAKRSPTSAPKGTKNSGPIRLGLVGIGRAGYGMIWQEVKGRDDCRVVACHDVIPERAEKLAAESGGRACASFEELIGSDDVDLLVIATRSNDHAEMAIRALKAGRNVLVEKPMATTAKDAARLVKAARGAKGQLLVRHNRRFDAPFLVAREIIKSGKLGPVYSVTLRQHGYQWRDDWQTILKYGGGQLLNWGPHVVDWALRLMDAPIVDQWSSLHRVAATGDAEDHVKIVLRGENGRVVDLEISGATAINSPNIVVLGKYGALEIRGSECRLKHLDDASRKQKARKADPGTPDPARGFGGTVKLNWVEQTFKAEPAHRPEFWTEIFKAVRKGGGFAVTLDEALQNIVVLDRARKGTSFEVRA